MLLPVAAQKAESGAELRSELNRRIPPHLQSAAAGGTREGEGGDQDVTARPNRTPGLRDVAPPLGGVGQEVKDRAIMPEIVCVGGQLSP